MTLSLLRTSSWIIRNKDTHHVLFETFSADVAGRINPSKYEAVPILQYLQEFNASLKTAQR